ncbi:N-acetylneuraminate synthase family protein [Desulfovibrio sp. OttesenSCG-928-C06]|nr:N-acetylneuraminate synthase family protein [Desulfovibrio sp. OttesenSCG-928-C06]
MSTIGAIFSDSSHPPVFLAEIGTFFNQDVAAGVRIVEEIARVRDNIKALPIMLKGEVLHDAEICRKTEIQEHYVDEDGVVHAENYRSLIERKVVPLEDYAAVFRRASSLGLELVLSVYDKAGAIFAVEQKAVMLKLASSNLRHAALHEAVAALNVPLIVDEGRAPLSAVAVTIERLRRLGADHILLEHSPDGHPALPEAHNLNIINSYRQAFGLPVGLSDHYNGEEMLYAATALGYSVLEKGIVPDRAASDQDISHAMPLDRMAKTLRKIYDVYLAVSGAPRRPQHRVIKGNVGTSAHMGIVTAKPVQAGETVSLESVSFAFPAEDGIGSEYWELVKGWSFKHALPQGVLLHWADIYTA